MKLKCEKHNKRVLVLKTTRVVHRINGEECDSPEVYIGHFTGTPVQVVIMQTQKEIGPFERHTRDGDC